MRWGKPIVLALGAGVVLLVAADVVWAQCAMCRTALLTSPEGQRLASSLNRGILFLLSAPFVVVGVIALLICKPHVGVWFWRVLGMHGKA